MIASVLARAASDRWARRGCEDFIFTFECNGKVERSDRLETFVVDLLDARTRGDAFKLKATAKNVTHLITEWPSGATEIH
jgi:hypothetical protein